jgi:hypothetical protein
MNFDKAGSCGPCEAVEHLTVLKTQVKETATVLDSPHDSETQYGRSHTQELREGADLITKGKNSAVIGLREDSFLAPGCSDEGPKEGQPFGMREDSFLPPADR